jgi:transcriptional regulator with XRE-family HTH domain
VPKISPEKAFGRELRKLRLKNNISQEELAGRSGYHRTYIGQLERGEKSPSLRTLFDLAATLNFLPSTLVKTIEKAVRL